MARTVLYEAANSMFTRSKHMSAHKRRAMDATVVLNGAVTNVRLWHWPKTRCYHASHVGRRHNIPLDPRKELSGCITRIENKQGWKIATKIEQRCQLYSPKSHRRDGGQDEATESEVANDLVSRLAHPVP